MKKTAIFCALMLCAGLFPGCDKVRAGNGLQGQWKGDLTQLLEVVDLFAGVPIPVSPAAVFTFDGGDLSIILDANIPILSWFVKAEVRGTYTEAVQGVVKTAELGLTSVGLKVCFFRIPLSTLNQNTVAAYEIIIDRLYFIPGYDLLPQNVRNLVENGTAAIPWQGGTIPNTGTQITPLSLTRM